MLSNNPAKIIEEIIQIGKLLYDKGYNAGKDGNISVRLDPQHILITKSGALLGFLTQEDCIVIDNNGNVFENTKGKPSSETIMHTGIYCQNPNVGAVIHAHAPYSISLSMLDLDTEKDLYTVSCGPIPITEIAQPSTKESWEKVQPFVKSRSKAILKRHGVVSWGKNLMTAFVKLEETEHFAKSLINAMAVKSVSPIDQETKNRLLKNWGLI